MAVSTRGSGRALALLAGLSATGCLQLDPRPTGSGPGLVEPEVFEVVRAANSRAAVEYLGQKHQDEMRQVRLLEEQIQQLVAAQAGLAAALEGHREDFDVAREGVAQLEAQVDLAEVAVTAAESRGVQAEARKAEIEGLAASAVEAAEKALTELNALLAAKEAERQSLEQQTEVSTRRIVELQTELEATSKLIERLDADESLAADRRLLQVLLARIEKKLAADDER